MSTATNGKCLRRDPAEVAPWAETCGQIRPLIEEQDGAAGEVHHVEIDHAKLHYHARTDEFYYVIDGQGTIRLVNEAYCHLVQKPREELEGKPLWTLYQPEHAEEIMRQRRFAQALQGRPVPSALEPAA